MLRSMSGVTRLSALRRCALLRSSSAVALSMPSASFSTLSISRSSPFSLVAQSYYSSELTRSPSYASCASSMLASFATSSSSISLPEASSSSSSSSFSLSLLRRSMSTSAAQDEHASEGSLATVDPMEFIQQWKSSNDSERMKVVKNWLSSSPSDLETFFENMVAVDTNVFPEPLLGGVECLVSMRSFAHDNKLTRDVQYAEGTAKITELVTELFASANNKRDSWGDVILSLDRVNATNIDRLEWIVKQETVHPVQDVHQLQNRIEGMNAIYQLTCNFLSTPIGHISVAMTSFPEEAGYVRRLLSQRYVSPQSAVATFYSVCTGQTGLYGLGLGERLVKGAARMVNTFYQQVNSIITLSPMPKFREWLAQQEDCDEVNLTQERIRELGLKYLLEAKNEDGLPLDRVARFHLANGAEIFQVHPAGDHSPRRMAESYGMMVNYKYSPTNPKMNVARYLNGTPTVDEQATLPYAHFDEEAATLLLKGHKHTGRGGFRGGRGGFRGGRGGAPGVSYGAAAPGGGGRGGYSPRGGAYRGDSSRSRGSRW